MSWIRIDPPFIWFGIIIVLLLFRHEMPDVVSRVLSIVLLLTTVVFVPLYILRDKASESSDK